VVTDSIVTAVLAALEALLTLMPDWQWPQRTVVGTVVFLGQANRVFPVATVAAMFGLFIALKLALGLWDLTLFVYHQFWGAS
jgi:hypothetical protein